MVSRPLSNTKWLVAVYAGAAVCLFPWIVFLWFTQRRNGTEHNVGLVVGGLLILLALATVASGLLNFRSSPVAVVAAGLAGSFALATLWFRLTAQPTRAPAATEIRAQFTLLLPVALLVWCGYQWLRRSEVTQRARLLVPLAYAVATALVAVGAIRLSSVAPSTEPEHHLRLVWTGLDVIEFVGLAWTAWCIAIGSRFVVFAATLTAAFLIADAWTNVVSSTSDARIAAVGMALIELSLAILSVGVAAHVATRSADPLE